MRIDTNDTNPEAADGRRARLVDLQRLEVAIAAASARLQALEEFIAKRDSAPIPRAEFYGQIYAMAALAGKRANAIRDWADIAWQSYQDALNGIARPTIDEVYGGKIPEPDGMPSNENAGC